MRYIGRAKFIERGFFNMYGFGGPLGIIEVIVGWGLQSTSLVLAGRFVKGVEKIAEKFESK